MVERESLVDEETDDRRWLSVLRSEIGDLPSFVYAVRTTGVFCLPTCRSRTPRRSNVVFFDSAAEAQRAGYRPCKKCRPGDRREENRHADVVRAACRVLSDPRETRTVASLAADSGLSVSRFRHVFRNSVGVSPKQYQSAARRCRLQTALRSTSVTRAIHEAGFESASRVYEQADQLLGMSPSAYRLGGRDQRLAYAVGECALGVLLVAISDRGICAILFGDDEEEAVTELQDRFDSAELVRDESLATVLEIVVRFVDEPSVGLALPLDVRGTAFQQRVWNALSTIPPGETRTYSQIAEEIGSRARAVGAACGANALAVAIPCHRVVSANGEPRGYRWGVPRKSALLERESG